MRRLSESETLAVRGTFAVRWLAVFGVGIGVCMLILGGLVLLDARQDAWRQAAQASQNLLLALDRDIGRNISVFDLSLQGVMQALAEPGIGKASPGVRRLAMFDTSASAEDLGSVFVMDAKGNVVEDSSTVEVPPHNLSDRDYFTEHRDHANVGLYLSRPFLSRVGGDLRIAVSRRIPNADGHFTGVVAGTLKLSFFHRLFEKLNVGAHGSIVLIRSDGRVVARYPFRDKDVDRDLSASNTFRHFAAAGEGFYVDRGALDGMKRLFAFRRIAGLPLILSVNTAVDDIFAIWQRKALVIGAILAILCTAVVTSSLLFQREMMRRTAAERTLRELARDLAVVAATDSLTGIPNRRAFEAEMDRLWSDPNQAASSVALLMIDIDHFKAYNDHYGHGEGDQVLKSVARCLAANLRGPQDLVARCGGEEFVVILPDTNAAIAQGVAERLRDAVASLAIGHVTHWGRVTVSIGIAAAPSLPTSKRDELLGAADEALYEAKRRGRNCVGFAREGAPRRNVAA